MIAETVLLRQLVETLEAQKRKMQSESVHLIYQPAQGTHVAVFDAHEGYYRGLDYSIDEVKKLIKEATK